MSIPTVLRALFTSFVALALTAAPTLAFGKHRGGGSRGGGGSHHGSSRGGGGFHGSNRGGGGFHLGGGGHSGRKSFRSTRSAAPRQTGGGSYSRFGGSANRANINSGYFGGRAASLNGPRSINATAGRRLISSDMRATAAGTYAPPRNFGSNRPPSPESPSQSWSAGRQSSRTATSRAATSFNSNRPPTAVSAPRNWSGQGQSSMASAPRSKSFSNSNRPPSAASTSRSWSGHGEFSSANALRSTSFFDRNSGISNPGNSRFGNSSLRHSSFSHSRTSSSVARFGTSRFGDAHQFDRGGPSFHGGNSFGGDDLSFVPDLFGLALNFGAFGLRGLGLLGTGLNAFGATTALGLLGSGLNGFGVGGLNSTGSGAGDFNINAAQASLPWGPSPILYPAGSCPLPQ
jgi:hypothetical protein